MANNHFVLRVRKEIQALHKGSDLSLAVYCDDSDVQDVQALIIGPPATPYEFGFFEFAFNFAEGYPTHAPKVKALTTNGGRTRFNPNIYRDGKVCLSILGTWRGEPGENWSSAQGLESVLLSIQSLMSPNPYENEPGYESRAVEEKDAANAYIAKIRHETIRISVIQRLEEYLGIAPKPSQATPRHSNWDLKDKSELVPSASSTSEAMSEPFVDLCKRRFLWYFSSYLNTIETEAVKHKDGKEFLLMPFEFNGNIMSGRFDYGGLKKRLLAIKGRLAVETSVWANEGIILAYENRSLALSFQRKFVQIQEDQRASVFNMELQLLDKNPFTWKIILYGKPMTKLEGGIFHITLNFSPRFPNEQPRVTVNTPIFHHRVSIDGTLCYLVEKPEEIASHIAGIIDALQLESNPYDPRMTVNPEASKLFWGNEAEKKQYNRKLRRSVEESAEF